MFIKRVIGSEVVTVSRGHQTRDFVYVNDGVRIEVKSMNILTATHMCESVHVCTGRAATISGPLDPVADIIGKTPKVKTKELPPGDPVKSSGTWEKMCEMFSIPSRRLHAFGAGAGKDNAGSIA